MFNAALTQMCNLAKLDREDTKRQMIQDASLGRTLHTDELSSRELESIVKHINNTIAQLNTNNSSDRMRKKILHYCHLMQWYTPEGNLNWARLNEWCIKFGHGHKKFNEYKPSELPTLVSQFEEVYKCFLNKI